MAVLEETLHAWTYMDYDARIASIHQQVFLPIPMNHCNDRVLCVDNFLSFVTELIKKIKDTDNLRLQILLYV